MIRVGFSNWEHAMEEPNKTEIIVRGKKFAYYFGTNKLFFIHEAAQGVSHSFREGLQRRF